MKKKRAKPTHLYVLSCDGKIKIGVTSDIDNRVKQLQTGNANPIILEYIERRYKPTKAESYLHRHFASKRREGEWFDGLTLADIRVQLMLFHDQEDDELETF